VKSDGTLWGTGYNNYGQLGDNSTIDRLIFIYVMPGVKTVAAGYSHTMIIRNDGRLLGTGYNRYGQLCYTDTLSDSTPQLVPLAISGVVKAVAVLENSTVFLRGDTLYGAGRNNYGELGVGDQLLRRPPILLTTGVSKVETGMGNTMIIKNDNTLRGTGYNAAGNLGLGHQNDVNTFDFVMSSVTDVSSGFFHTMIIKTDGTLWGTGTNEYGQFGNGDTASIVTPPVLAWPR
jgi:alpha-tubulin suppressor-like RCC1 family protein